MKKQDKKTGTGFGDTCEHSVFDDGGGTVFNSLLCFIAEL